MTHRTATECPMELGARTKTDCQGRFRALQATTVAPEPLLPLQEARERRALCDPTTGHLAHHEIMELYDLSPKPPMPEIYSDTT
jgi:hypothetical protein